MQPATPRTEHVQVLYMPEDMQRLKNSLVAERSKNKRLLRFLEKKELERQKSSRLVWYAVEPPKLEIGLVCFVEKLSLFLFHHSNKLR